MRRLVLPLFAAALLGAAGALGLAFHLAGCGAGAGGAPWRDALEGLASLPYLQARPIARGEASSSGVVFWDREEASPGLNVACAEGRPGGRVFDLAGRTALALPDPRRDSEDCRLLEAAGDGSGWIVLTVEGRLLRLDPAGRLRLELGPGLHHDADIGPDGRLYALAERLRYRTPLSWRPLRDHLLRIADPSGRPLREVSLARLAEGDPALASLVAGRRMKYPLSLTDNAFNANTVEVLRRDVERDGKTLFRRGQILTCLRNLDLVGVLDLATERFVWTWGPGELEHPHHPSLLPSGNLLIFDNGRYRGWSRVVELDPGTGGIVWQWRGDPPASFYSQSRGAAQRLANGDTLITDSEAGRAFEVTAAGRIVWDYREPAVSGGRKRPALYRLQRIPELPGATGARPPPRVGRAAAGVP